MNDDAKSRRQARARQKRAEERAKDPTAMTCPLCVAQIEHSGVTEQGDTQPYKARSMITHFKQYHDTNSLGVDKALGLAPGTTQVCSPDLIENTFKPAGARGATALAAKNLQGKKVDLIALEDAAIEAMGE